MKRLSLLFLLLVVPLACSAQPGLTAMSETAGVVVIEDASGLSPAEEKLLRRLEKRMVPLPDTIEVRYRTRGNADYRDGKVILSGSRHRFPKDAAGEFPYLYGRTSAENPSLAAYSAHSLAHEIAHHLQWLMWNGEPRLQPPMWWRMDTARRPYTIRMETEADLMAAALLHMTFGTETGALGFPENTWAGPADSLAHDYEGRIEDFYRIHQN